MKYFVNRIVLFLILLFALLNIILFLLYFTDLFKDGNGANIVVNISNSYTKKKIKKIYLGDSVADQLFGHHISDSSGCVSMTLNAAMTVYGHYMLLDNFYTNNINYIDSNTEVVLMISLKGLSTDLTRPTTYNYFVKPFYNREFILKHNEPYVLDQLSNYNFLALSQSPILKERQFLTENIDQSNYNLLSKINIIGFTKIINFCKEKNIKLSIYVLPLSDFWENEIPLFKKEFNKSGVKVLSTVINNFVTTPDSNFVFDHVHFKNSYKGKAFLNGYNAILKPINFEFNAR
jgi:hypothetical protein